MKNFTIAVLLVVSAVLATLHFGVVAPLGVSSGPLSTETQLVPQYVRYGVDSLGSGATSSITAAQVCNNSTLTRNPATATASTTLPTAIALGGDCLPNTGAITEIVLLNTSATAASSTVIAAPNASTTLILGSAGAATSTVTVAGGTAAKLTFIRTAAETQTVLVHTFKTP